MGFQRDQNIPAEFVKTTVRDIRIHPDNKTAQVVFQEDASISGYQNVSDVRISLQPIIDQMTAGQKNTVRTFLKAVVANALDASVGDINGEVFSD